MKFLNFQALLEGHDALVLQHGGLPGVRDPNLLQSALYRPLQKHLYGEDDVHVLAAAYAYGLAKNHPFLDCNKRSAWLATTAFLFLNGYQTHTMTPETIGDNMVALAAGEMTEDSFVVWLRKNFT